MDHNPLVSNSIHTVSHYSFFPGKPRWPASKTRLTYAFEANTPAAAINPVVRAFNTWASATHFTFSRVQNIAAADLVIGFHRRNHGDGLPFDGPGGVLVHAFAPTNGRFHYDADDRFSVGAAAGASDLETVALHEIGHLLGLATAQFTHQFATMVVWWHKNHGNDDGRGVQLQQ
ncbi:unnamed protein product [Fraxinus pennsylvanica]|uniref:Peptidase metallopeptidase domain-containing protein n=1 Tax=Fraxinus pennsylvanica TaxID=56036 RepID=A0AAD2ACE9_9LAMI|nr:unnamed protein product [Fraxinus pennsylvanica]